MTYHDKTYCASPDCKNECGRKMTDEAKVVLFDNDLISYAYFCGEPKAINKDE